MTTPKAFWALIGVWIRASRQQRRWTQAMLASRAGVPVSTLLWSLAPFYDFARSQGPNGWHTLSIAGEGEHPQEKDLLRLADSVSLEPSDAKAIFKQTQSACESFPSLAKDLSIFLFLALVALASF